METSKDLSNLLRTRMKQTLINDKSSGILVSVLTGIGKRVEGVYRDPKSGTHTVQFLFEAPKEIPELYFTQEYLHTIKTEIEDDTRIVSITQGEVKALLEALRDASQYIKDEEETGDGHAFRRAENCSQYVDCTEQMEVLLQKLS